MRMNKQQIPDDVYMAVRKMLASATKWRVATELGISALSLDCIYHRESLRPEAVARVRSKLRSLGLLEAA